jgi:lipoic acid synthetase
VKKGLPSLVDAEESERIAQAAQDMGLRYVVITSVTRDDLPDRGAAHYAATIRAIRQRLPETTIEVLIPDFAGESGPLKIVLDANPDVLNHNMETVRRLYCTVRPFADYSRSLCLLKEAKTLSPNTRTKSGLMVGLGENIDEVHELMRDLRGVDCDFLTIGQYLRPSKKNLPVVEYINPNIFEALKEMAAALGFRRVAAGPLVRSSMNAEEIYRG